ncbi:flagellar biosynthesis protein FlhA [Porticoccus sp. W117]|uniref:flagellar biosynthesis protein FlhA n=1 Tax=Porticoccus sp. W117 TaxID=3054777 RepID=UPI0025990508|nr:flagellar biosynthesis protein FlhA [Porticoccus sp. W117]MDM3870975.1 flagellar biosynthesis protein FlhA [Porticoccus sp. W117]
MKELLGNLGSGRFSVLGLGTPVLLMVMLSMMVLPLPAPLLDLLFTFNIALSLIVLLASIYTKRPLEFAVFPTVLLVATLLRLGLNVASTRVVLMNGHTGTGAAGEVIEAFGEFVIGGNYAVGFVVFAILVIINFVVVTKGAGRISEVNARFTLDAMPGKQMAIDADLNAGIINSDEARLRREEVSQEADFYGAMDGASKFVRGDAVAGILILLINIVGGLSVGVAQHNLSFEQAGHNYVLLTIGDGLVAQIPSLLLSTAAAIIVTRVSSSQDMGQQMMSQLFGNPRALAVSAGVVLILGLVPGMPNLVFLTIGAGLAGLAYWLSQRKKVELVDESQQPRPEEQPQEVRELSWDDVQPVDMIGLEVGYRLISLVDKTQGGELLSRIKGVRKKLSQELGFLVQPVHIRDNLDLSPSAYRITLQDVPVGESEVYPGKELAINPGQVFGELNGIPGEDPAFGLQAVWIEPSQRDEAQTMGYTVVDCSTVVATHLSQLLKDNACDLLGHDEVQQLLDVLAKSSPKLVENLVPKTLSLGVVLKVMQNLLHESIPIRDVRSIAEALAEHAPRTQEADPLTASVRVALGRTIFQGIAGMETELQVMTFDPELEQMLQNSLQNGGGGIEPGLAESMMRQINANSRRQEAAGQEPVLLVSSPLRLWLSRLLRGNAPSLHVLAYDEIPANKRVKVTASVGRESMALAG